MQEDNILSKIKYSIAIIFRHLPHASYGNYGGLFRSRKTKPPIDDLDYLFMKHDRTSEKARLIRKQADIQLAQDLKKPIKHYRRWYGYIYHQIAKIIFKG